VMFVGATYAATGATAASPLTMASSATLRNELIANSSSPKVPEARRIFDRFAGRWNLECDRWDENGTKAHSSGTWTFGWILDGTMLQDAIYFNNQSSAGHRIGGTTLRFFDSAANTWRVVFFAPARNAVISLTGDVIGERIILNGIDVDGAKLRWSFNDITQASFVWRGEISYDDGKTWRLEQEMHLHRT
jgi:hypothetical protein